MWTTAFAQTQTPAAPAANGAAPGTAEQAAPTLFGNPLIMIVAFVAIMYFFMFRPQQKKDRERRDMLASLSKGDQVLTSGGIVGTVMSIREKTVILRVNDEDNLKIEFLRGAIAQVMSRGDDPKK